MKREGKFYVWSVEDDQYIVANYSKLLFRQMAAHLGVPWGSLQTHVEKLIKSGVLKRRNRKYQPKWEQWEIDYLIESYGRVSDKTIRRKLKRSQAAITLKKKRLGLTKNMSYLTCADCQKIFGLDAHKVRRWIYDGKLIARQSPWKYGSFPVWIIEYEALENFIKNHPNEYDPRRVDREEYPMWHKLVMKWGFPDDAVLFPRAWEQWEVDYVINNFPRLGPIEMSPVLRRSTDKVRGKIEKLRKQGLVTEFRTRGMYRNDLWQEWEDKFLAAHYRKLTFKEIGGVLGRTSVACEARMRTLTRSGHAPLLVAEYYRELSVDEKVA